jgi:hypothetical protein
LIKKEWITAKNGFKKGELCLYLHPDNKALSAVFIMGDLSSAVESKMPSLVDGRSVLKINSINPASPYPAPIYCELDGELYPIQSQQWSIWNTGDLDAGRYLGAVIRESSLTRRNRQLVLSMDGYSLDPHNGEVVDRPDWAPGFKL